MEQIRKNEAILSKVQLQSKLKSKLHQKLIVNQLVLFFGKSLQAVLFFQKKIKMFFP